MLTIALLTLSTADARPASYHKCSGYNPHVGSYAYMVSSQACTCLGAKDGSSAWWGGVDLTALPEDAPDGTCFENDVWEASLTGALPTTEAKVRANLYDIADAIAKKQEVWYHESWFDIYFGWSEASIVAMGDGETISNPIDPNDFQFPWLFEFEEMFPGGPYAMFDPNAEPWFHLNATAPVSHAVATDSNQDGITDVVVVLVNGDIWEIEGPIGPGEWFEPPMD